MYELQQGRGGDKKIQISLPNQYMDGSKLMVFEVVFSKGRTV